MHLHPVLRQPFADEGAECPIDRREHLGALLELSDRQPTGDERFGHLQADVAGSDDDCPRRRLLLERLHDREGVAHRVEKMHAVVRTETLGSAKTLELRPYRDGAGPDHERVVRQHLLSPSRTAEQDPVAGDVDPVGNGVETERDTRRLELADRPVCKRSPVGHLAGDVVGDAADGEVGVAVGDDHRHLGGPVELQRTKRRADPRVAAADRYEVHEYSDAPGLARG